MKKYNKPKELPPIEKPIQRQIEIICNSVKIIKNQTKP